LTGMINARLATLQLRLPALPIPRGEYDSHIIHGTVAYVSGQVCRDDHDVVKGPIGDSMSERTISRAAELCVLRSLSVLHHALGSLDLVEQILFVRGFVFAPSTFSEHSRILDPVSRLFLEIFGDRGRHARSAIGVSSLPSGGLLEIEITAAVTRHS